ncbi:MAG: hypothetical protein QOH08_1866 [Chloroflexota bacterium]|jgi:hypothetical protein|nr:hypothetical protein [Chloroflexota bacterium]
MPIVRAINVGQPGRTTVASAVETNLKEDTMSKEVEPKDQQDEIEEQDAAELPDREAMSLVNANLAAPINAAVAANVLSDNSVAYANAEQTAPINQGNLTNPVK